MNKKQQQSYIKNLLAGYQAAERIDRQALANLTDEAAMRAIQRIFSVKVDHINADRLAYSGLIELQSQLKKLRR